MRLDLSCRFNIKQINTKYEKNKLFSLLNLFACVIIVNQAQAQKPAVIK